MCAHVSTTGSPPCGQLEHEAIHLRLIQMTVRAHTAAKVDAPWLNLDDRGADVVRSQASRQKDGCANCSPDLRAQAPLVGPPRSSELFRGELLVTRIEQERVNLRRDVHRLLDGLSAIHVNNLD